MYSSLYRSLCSSFRLACQDKSMPRFLLPALAALTVLAVTPAFAAAGASGADSDIDWWNMGMSLFGGLALFLFGMEQMADALKAVAGERMKVILAKLTTNRFMGAATGAFVTAIIQSSSVTTVLVVGFITAGLMSMSQSVGVIMGANIGTTITAQIVAFKVTKAALLMVAVGFGMLFFSKQEKIKQYGGMLMGLGLVFFGMSVMSYRTSEESSIVDSLVNAARNGKQVAVLVELKARFDEAANIRWARRMEQAGIHVTYGVVGLKTHSKVILVVRKDYNGLRRYAHIGTGNYHAGTARLYCDLGMLTCDNDIAQDLTELFNYLTGYSQPPRYRKILTSPYTLKKTLLEKIDREIKQHSAETPGLIQLKMNALEDVDITRALYRASQAGVKVDLIVRDTCRLRPGLPGLTENTQVIGVIGRFLEHARIYYFFNQGDEEYFIGSADLMTRNLESRVEVVTPVEDPKLRQERRLIIDVQLSSRKDVWEMQSDGSYIERKDSSGKKTLSSQETFIQLAQKRMAAASKHQQAKLRKKLLNHFHNRLKHS